ASVARFDFGADDHIGPGKLIPMFGVSNLITGLEYTPGWTTDLGTLHLLRAYAKVRVRADSEGLDITSAKLTNAHDALMRAPQGVSRHDDYVGDSYAADYYHKVSVPEGAGIVSGVKFHKDDSGDWVIYLPEFVNVDGGHADRPLDARDRCRIEVVFEGESSPQYVDFKYYDTPPAYAEGFRKGDYFDVLRNNIYDFTLCRLEGEKELSVEVDVIPYGEVLLAPDYGLERDENTGWIIIDSYDERYYYADKDYQYYNKDRQPIATRVEMTPDRKRYIVRWPRTKEVMYSFDPLTEKYYTDYEGTEPLVSPMQLAKFFNSMIDNGKTYLVLRTDKFGKIMYLWDVSAGVCLDENMNRHTPTINHGYQLYKGVDIGVGSSAIVIGIDSNGRYRFFYDPATGKYYRDASGNDNISIMETEAFPPIQ
ncbi:MAG: hypothetical protein K2L80_07295, partial [Muribaculaceae bacterium]|nr:hypothetical protein [Muribaculaceae bacterium]